MTFRTQIVSLVVVAGLLALAATSPRSTYRIASKPFRAINKLKWEKQRQASHDQWSQLLTEAESGDAYAMSRVGRRMMEPISVRWTGIEEDSVRGEQFVRAAAELGDPGALLQVWKLDGAEPEALEGLTNQVLAGDPEFLTLIGLSSAIRQSMLDGCDSELRMGLGEVVKRTIDLDESRAEYLADNLEEFDVVLNDYCAEPDSVGG